MKNSLTHNFWRRQEQRMLGGLHHGIARWYLGKPDLAELLRIKMPDLSSVGTAALNEAAFRLKTARTFRVMSLNIETTNYCNLACTICPVNRGMVRKKRHLDPALFEDLLNRTPGLKFVLPFQWGEPLLHPDIHRMVQMATDRGIRTMLTTNGTLLDDSLIQRLLDAGLTRLTVSVDGDDSTHETIRDASLQQLRERVAALKQARDARRSPMQIDVSMVLDEATRPALQRYRQEWQTVVDRVQVIPRLEQQPRSHACRELWRGSLVVLVDGTVTACCADSEGQLALGNALQQAPAQILNNSKFKELRRQHRRGEFPDPCRQCSEYGGQDVGVSPRFQ